MNRSNLKKELQIKVNMMMKMVTDWCSQAEVELNVKKTEILNLSKKRNDVEIEMSGEKVTFKQSLKYLGVVIDDKLKFKAHLEHLYKKTAKLLECVRKMMWMNKETKIKYKKKIYYNVFLPMISYASEIWFKEMKTKKTYLNELEKMQRLIVRAITGCYKSTSKEKLLELLKINTIEEELTIKDATLEVDKDQRKEVKDELRKLYLKEKKSFGFDLNIDETSSRYMIWCISTHGPFREYLNKRKLVENEWCRFCKMVPETVIHLVNECEYIKLENLKLLEYEVNEDNLEKLVNELIKKLMKVE